MKIKRGESLEILDTTSIFYMHQLNIHIRQASGWYQVDQFKYAQVEKSEKEVLIWLSLQKVLHCLYFSHLQNVETWTKRYGEHYRYCTWR